VTLRARAVAFYLPQFHPIPENDRWWGKGFTEWINVARATPAFRGHLQPRLPTELGYYDLRLPEVRAAQAELAQAHGIEAFCYWHYWFNGQRLIERPFNEVLQSGEPPFGFCLAWANESWSRRWLGEARDILMQQVYSPEDDLAHIRWLATAFADPRYVRIEGRPLFLIYRPRDLPEPRRTTDTFRRECQRLGLPDPYLVGIDAHSVGTDMRQLGFDLTQNFRPQLGALPHAFDEGLSLRTTRHNIWHGVWAGSVKVYDYDEAVDLMDRGRPDHPHFPAIFVGWDNTPRRGKRAIVIRGSTPEAIARRLREVVNSIQQQPPEHRIVFINAWNEWAEGNYLEPDALNGRGLLEAVASVLRHEDP
jgi:hypothetical protein